MQGACSRDYKVLGRNYENTDEEMALKNAALKENLNKSQELRNEFLAYDLS